MSGLRRIVAAFTAVLVLGLQPAFAAFTDSDMTSTADMIKHEIPIYIQGQLTANKTAIIKIPVTEKWIVTNVKSVCRAKTGTITVDILKDGVSILDPVTTLTSAGTVYSSVFAASATTVTFAAGTVLSVDLAVGTNLDDLTITVTYRTKVSGE